MNALGQPARSYISYGGQQTNIENATYTAREVVQANALTRQDIERLEAVCVRTSAVDSTFGHLR